jgi:phosphatidylserine decarboxylase
LQGRRNPFVAQEGIPFLLASILLCWISFRYLNVLWLGGAIGLSVILFLIFRDPRRRIPAVPLGVVSPVDGRIVAVDLVDKGVLQGEAHRIVVRINSLGTYTARCPIEGKIMDLNSVASDKVVDYRTNALWVQADEGDNVVLQFRGYRFGLAPISFVGYGERLGQGSRCAYLRLTRFAEIHMPIDSTVLVEPGQRVVAGCDLLGKLPHP